ncbi:MAG: aldo/keto reductase [Alphaproteobacteria bacterium]
MDYRRLGGTDLDVSVLCYGPMRAAAKAPGDDERSRSGARALAAALECGINFIHSSYEYGVRWMMNGVLKDHPKRHDIHHVIKVPVPDFADGGRFDAAKFRLRVEEALRDLAAERIAVLQWLWRSEPNDDALRLPMLPAVIDEAIATFEALRDEGKAGWLMPFPYTVPCARAAVEAGRFAGLAAYYNPLEMEMAALFPEMERRAMGFLCIRPLYQGILTDRRPNQEALDEGDRLKAPEHAALFARRAAVASAFADEIGESMTSFALRFPLFSPVVASVVVGLNSEDQVRDAVARMDGISPRPDLVERARALEPAPDQR